MEMIDRSGGGVDVRSEIHINYSFNRHPMRGYQCAYTEGMDKYGSPELCLMDYYSPEEAELILTSMADIVLNGDLFDPNTQSYDFFTIIELEVEIEPEYVGEGVDQNYTYSFGFIGGELYEHPCMCLQELDADERPIHPGEDFLPSYSRRGFEVWPTFMYVDDDEFDDDEWDGDGENE